MYFYVIKQHKPKIQESVNLLDYTTEAHLKYSFGTSQIIYKCKQKFINRHASIKLSMSDSLPRHPLKLIFPLHTGSGSAKRIRKVVNFRS